MKIFRKAALPAAIGVALSGGLPGTAVAATPGWYMGASAGALDYSLSASQVSGAAETYLSSFNAPVTSIYTFNDPGSGVNTSLDDSSSGGKLFVGYRFNEYVSLEAYYADFGNVKATYSGTVDGGEGVSGNSKTDLSGYGASVVGTVPVGGGFAGFAKVGWFRWDTSSSGSITVSGTEGQTLPLSGDDKNSNLTYGVGISYDINAHIGVRIEYERFDYGGTEFDPNDVTLISGGVVWNF